MAGLILTAVLGWFAGAAGNLLAETLPPRPEDSAPGAPSHLIHYWTLLWYFVRRGVCPGCGEAVSIRAPLLELTCIAAFTAGWFRFGDDPIALALFCLYAWLLLTVAAIDLAHRLVLNVMVFPAAVIVLGLSLLPPAPEPSSALLGGAAGFGLVLLIYLFTRGTLGAGDVKLAAVIGLMTGFPTVLYALLWGILFGGIGAVAIIITKRGGLKTYFAYAPYLCLGALLALYFRVL